MTSFGVLTGDSPLSVGPDQPGMPARNAGTDRPARQARVGPDAVAGLLAEQDSARRRP